ncbi:MAG: hypothetical protein GQ564_06635 [Bacteroidales bacterium]|nr:hypothetical protein [Bacteroidales bacterium]
MLSEINLRQKRGLGNIISDSFNYLRFHFKSLFKILLFVCGPILLLGGILLGISYSNLFKNMDFNSAASPITSGFGLGLLISFVIIGLGVLALNGIITEYMKVSLIKSRTEITFNDVISGFKQRFWKYFLAMIIVVIILFVSMFFFILPMIWLGIVFSLIFFIIGVENTGSFESIGRCFKLVKGYWWRTFGLHFLMGLIQTGLTYAFILPVYIIGAALMFSSEDPMLLAENLPIVMMIFMPFIILIGSLSYSLSSIASGINYFSIVEVKEEIGLKERIEKIETEN